VAGADRLVGVAQQRWLARAVAALLDDDEVAVRARRADPGDHQQPAHGALAGAAVEVHDRVGRWCRRGGGQDGHRQPDTAALGLVVVLRHVEGAAEHVLSGQLVGALAFGERALGSGCLLVLVAGG
jgi:hypothetical protein